MRVSTEPTIRALTLVPCPASSARMQAAAARPDRVNLEDVRRGQFEGLRETAHRDAARRPDVGGPELHRTAGAAVVAVSSLYATAPVGLFGSDEPVPLKLSAVYAVPLYGPPALATGVSAGSAAIAADVVLAADARPSVLVTVSVTV